MEKGAKRRGARGGRRAGAGRKPVPIERHRRRAAIVRFTDAEYAAVLLAVGDAKLATWLHAQIVALVRRRAKQKRT